MDSVDAYLIPFAMLISLIYEDKDEELLKAANDFIVKNGLYQLLLPLIYEIQINHNIFIISIGIANNHKFCRSNFI